MELVNKKMGDSKIDLDDQISRMLGHSDTIHLFDDERSYESALEHNNWPPIGVRTTSVVNIANTNFQPTKRYCAQNKKYSNQQSAITNYDAPIVISSSCCSSQEKYSRNGDSKQILNVNLMTKHIWYRRLCLFSILVAFIIGVLLGVLIPFAYITKDSFTQDSNSSRYQSLIVINKPVNVTSFNTTIRLQNSHYNSSSDHREYQPVVDKFDYIKSKLEFPTIHDIQYTNKDKIGKSKINNSLKLNKPKNFHSVSFVGDEKMENLQNINNRDGSITKDTLIKYLDLEMSNGTNNFFDDFGKKILESSLDERPSEMSKADKSNETILHNNIYWGSQIEKSLPNGFGDESNKHWTNFIKSSSSIKMESGCGRMQNRLVTFSDGSQACVRYRQNTDQIQGELFSFYLAQLLNLPNLAPSLVSIVNLTDPLWHNVASDIGSAQWNSNRPVVMTKYIPNLEAAHIPGVFKPSERHLNKVDIFNFVNKANDKNEKKNKENGNLLLKKITEGLFVDKDINSNIIQDIEEEESKINTNVLPEDLKQYPEHLKSEIDASMLDKFVELAQWSDLIIFDYLTANLDRIVNNLYNFQWNVNMMDAPAHNLARKVDSNLLLFLDNESGLLHGYRLLHKYEAYHSLLLDSLCIFRKPTANIIKTLHSDGNIGDLLNKMFRDSNNANVLDILPPLPEKNIKILNERIARVAGKIKTCEDQFGR